MGGVEIIDDPLQAKMVYLHPILRLLMLLQGSPTDTALGICRTQAGTYHPHKLALARLALASTTSDFKYSSWAPVESIEATSWTVTNGGGFVLVRS